MSLTAVRTLFARALLSAGALALTLPACVTEDAGPTRVPAGEVATDDDGQMATDLDAEQPQAGAAGSPGVIAALAPKSQGFYSFPYEAGTTVHVTNDAITHDPENRIDM